MTVKTISLGTPYRWLSEAFALCRAHGRVLFGAAALLVVVALVPTVLQLLVEAALAPSPQTRVALQVLFSLISLLLFPPIVGGFYRLAQSVHAGQPAAAFDVFSVYGDGAAAIRLILANLVFVLVSILVIAVLAFAFGGQDLLDFLRTMMTLKPGTTELPAMPSGLLPLLCALVILSLLIMTAQGLTMAEVAITGRAPMAAVGNGFKTALRNIGALLLFYLPIGLLLAVFGGILSVVAALLGMLLAVVNPLLPLLLIVPIALFALTLLYALMFTFFHQAWRETLGGDAPLPSAHQIAA